MRELSKTGLQEFERVWNSTFALNREARRNAAISAYLDAAEREYQETAHLKSKPISERETPPGDYAELCYNLLHAANYFERRDDDAMVDTCRNAEAAIRDLSARLAEAERRMTVGQRILDTSGEYETQLRKERDAARDECARLREALKPFARVAESDIGVDEADTDFFRPMSHGRNRAPLLLVGDIRRARAAISARQGGE